MKQYECGTCHFVSTNASDICSPKIDVSKAVPVTGKYVCVTCGDSASSKKELCHPKE